LAHQRKVRGGFVALDLSRLDKGKREKVNKP